MSYETYLSSKNSYIFLRKNAKSESSTPPAKITSSSHTLLNSGEIGSEPSLLTMIQYTII